MSAKLSEVLKINEEGEVKPRKWAALFNQETEAARVVRAYINYRAACLEMGRQTPPLTLRAYCESAKLPFSLEAAGLLEELGFIG